MGTFARRPAVIAAAGLLAAVAVLLAIWTTRGSDPAAAPIGVETGDPEIVDSGEPVPDETLPPVTYDALLAASGGSLARYDAHELRAESVPVFEVAGPEAVWIGQSAARRVLVVLVGAPQPFRVKAGDRMSFTGLLARADAEFGAALGLKGDDLRTFRRHGVYVEISEYRSN